MKQKLPKKNKDLVILQDHYLNSEEKSLLHFDWKDNTCIINPKEGEQTSNEIIDIIKEEHKGPLYRIETEDGTIMCGIGSIITNGEGLPGYTPITLMGNTEMYSKRIDSLNIGPWKKVHNEERAQVDYRILVWAANAWVKPIYIYRSLYNDCFPIYRIILQKGIVITSGLLITPDNQLIKPYKLKKGDRLLCRFPSNKKKTTNTTNITYERQKAFYHKFI